MHEEKRNIRISKKEAYQKNNVIVKVEKQKEQKGDYYAKSMNALIHYMENNEINPSENRWDRYAICEKYLSSKTIGYLSGMGFNTLCRKLRKELNKKKRQMKD